MELPSERMGDSRVSFDTTPNISAMKFLKGQPPPLTSSQSCPGFRKLKIRSFRRKSKENVCFEIPKLVSQ